MSCDTSVFVWIVKKSSDNAQKTRQKNTKINKLAFKGLQFSIHNANMTVLFGNVPDTDTDIVSVNVPHEAKNNRVTNTILRKEVF